MKFCGSAHNPMHLDAANSKLATYTVWLPDMDLNHDKQIQSLLCYRYTIGQERAPRLRSPRGQSRFVQSLKRCIVTSAAAQPVTAVPFQRFNDLTI